MHADTDIDNSSALADAGAVTGDVAGKQKQISPWSRAS
jgi:hypothetical protein